MLNLCCTCKICLVLFKHLFLSHQIALLILSSSVFLVVLCCSICFRPVDVSRGMLRSKYSMWLSLEAGRGLISRTRLRHAANSHGFVQ